MPAEDWRSVTCSGCKDSQGIIGEDCYRCPLCHHELKLQAMERHGGEEHWRWRCIRCEKSWHKVREVAHAG